MSVSLSFHLLQRVFSSFSCHTVQRVSCFQLSLLPGLIPHHAPVHGCLCSVRAAGNGCGMVTWWAAAQLLSLSLRKARLLTTLAPKHFTGSQRLTPTGIIASLWKVLRKETKLENFVSIFRWLILFFFCISCFVCPDCSSPASHHSTWCKFNPSSHNLGTLQTRTSSSRS